MIGKAYRPGRGFKGLARYLRDGHLGEESPDRVAWMETRNLPTRNPEVAACFMAATARRSARTEKPLYHLSVSFDREDAVDRALMRRVADRTLRDLGLEGHQVLIVAHCDRAHPHLHFMINRVHPERGTAWSDSFAYRRIERTLRAQEVELGLRVVPGLHARVPDRQQERPAQRLPRGGPDFVARVQRDAGPVLLHAGSWAEVEQGLAADGLSVRIKGGGLVVTDGREEAKASQIDRAVSRRQMESRLGPMGDYLARKAVADRALEERARHAEPPAPAQPTTPQAPQPKTHPTPVEPPQPATPPRATEPAPPAQLVLPLEQEPRKVPPRRPEPARPEAPARTPEPPRAPEKRTSAPTPTRAPEPRPAAPRTQAPMRATPPPPLPAPPAPEPVRERDPHRPPTYREAAREYSRAAGAIFTDPAAARRAFRAAAARHGPQAAATLLANEPHRFGTLRIRVTWGAAARAADAAYAYLLRQEERVRPTLRRAAGLVREAEAARQADRELRQALDAASEAARDAQRIQRARMQGLAARSAVAQTAAEVYADPERALEAIHAHRRQRGTDETARVVADSPERFGALRADEPRTLLAKLMPRTDRVARVRARLLAGDLRHHAWAFDALPSVEDVSRAALRVKEAEKASEVARVVFGRVRDVNPSRNLREAAAHLRTLVRGAPGREEQIARQLAAMVPRSAWGLMNTTIQMAGGIDPDYERGRDRGRGLDI